MYELSPPVVGTGNDNLNTKKKNRKDYLGTVVKDSCIISQEMFVCALLLGHQILTGAHCGAHALLAGTPLSKINDMHNNVRPAFHLESILTHFRWDLNWLRLKSAVRRK